MLLFIGGYDPDGRLRVPEVHIMLRISSILSKSQLHIICLSYTCKMGDLSIPKKKFNTELKDYSGNHADKIGPYAENLEVDAVIVGAGFGKLLS